MRRRRGSPVGSDPLLRPSLGLGIPLLLSALGISRVLRVFTFARRHALAVMRIGGVLLVGHGILEVTGLWGVWLASLRTLIGAPL